jgi:lysylphosphatidylglycerol synthetase-like protein (DUF2156 family)
VTLSDLAAQVRATAGVSGAPIELLRRYGDHSSGFLAINRQTRHYTAAGLDGFVAYRPAGRRHAIQLCGPFAAPEDRERLLRSFLEWARSHGRRVLAVQLTADEARIYARGDFVVNQLGSSYSIDLGAFVLGGTRFFKLRNKLKRARRLGVAVEEVASPQLESASVQAELDAIDASWLRGKGRHVKELAFMVGERGGPGAPLRRTFVARRAGEAVAYVTYSPCFGRRPGWLYDLTRRRADAPPGTIELIFLTALEQLQREECRWLHLGLTPLVGLADVHELPGASSATVRRIVRLLAEHGSAIYPARNQLAFKLKWAPHVIEPEYVGFESRASLAAIWQLMRVTRAI